MYLTKIPVITEGETQLFPIDLKCPQCFKKKLKGKQINQTQIYSGGPPACAHGVKYKQKYLIEPCAKVCQSCQSSLMRLYLKLFFPDLVHRPIRNLTPHYNSQFCVSFVSVFIFVFIRKPADVCKHV